MNKVIVLLSLLVVSFFTNAKSNTNNRHINSDEIYNEEYIQSLSDASYYYSYKGDFPKAIELEERALQIKIEKFGQEHLQCAVSLNSLMVLLHFLNKDLCELELGKKALDRFMWTLLTRLDKKFISRKESRIILAGRNITQFDDSVCGYRVDIPIEAIKKIYIYKNTPDVFIEKLSDKGVKFSFV